MRRAWRTRLPRRHLHLQIFMGFLGILLLLALLTGALFWHYTGNTMRSADEHVATLLARLLPLSADAQETDEVLRAISGLSGGSVALYAPDGHLLKAIGGAEARLELKPNAREFERPFHPAILPDGRRLMLEWGQRGPSGHFGWIALFLLLAAVGSYPIARRLTRRIEALRDQAEAWGHGDLAARASEQGCDEIAELARHFNSAAERIASLLDSQRAMLAAASHELRSPLTRIRMASGLIGDERQDLQAQIARDIGELDALIGDLLLASRLSSSTPHLHPESVDLLGLAAEEAARTGAELSGDALSVHADAKLLRHLLRNLLENGRRHAAGSPIEVQVVALEAGGGILRVLDRGPGVPEGEREKVFEPFYRPAGSVETGEGVGYGLALVQRIARLHGGDARCLPREGGGACFEVSWPTTPALG